MSVYSLFFGKGPVHVVFLTTKTGQNFKGVLVARDREVLVLRAARLASVDQRTGGQTWATVQGDVVVPMDNVDFWQEGLDPSIIDQ